MQNTIRILCNLLLGLPSTRAGDAYHVYAHQPHAKQHQNCFMMTDNSCRGCVLCPYTSNNQYFQAHQDSAAWADIAALSFRGFLYRAEMRGIVSSQYWYMDGENDIENIRKERRYLISQVNLAVVIHVYETGAWPLINHLCWIRLDLLLGSRGDGRLRLLCTTATLSFVLPCLSTTFQALQLKWAL
jgi:hypothetical protein